MLVSVSAWKSQIFTAACVVWSRIWCQILFLVLPIVHTGFVQCPIRIHVNWNLVKFVSNAAANSAAVKNRNFCIFKILIRYVYFYFLIGIVIGRNSLKIIFFIKVFEKKKTFVNLSDWFIPTTAASTRRNGPRYLVNYKFLVLGKQNENLHFCSYNNAWSWNLYRGFVTRRKDPIRRDFWKLQCLRGKIGQKRKGGLYLYIF